MSIAVTVALVALLLVARPAGAAPGGPERFTPPELEPLLGQLVKEGFSRQWLNEVFYDPRLMKVPRVISLNALTQETERLYQDFVTPYAIRKARRYRRRHFRELMTAERRFGVSRDVIVAVLLVETQFGTYPLRYRALEVFTTLAVDGQPQAADRYFEQLKPQHPHLELEYLQARLLQKAAWAYDELVALLQVQLPGRTPYDIMGSYAGAFGMAQFLPSSYLRWAVDGNGDGQIDLDQHADAIASTANYLRAHGWKSDAGLGPKISALWEYNNSRPYVNTILEVSRLMNRPAQKPRRKSRRSSRPRAPATSPAPVARAPVAPLPQVGGPASAAAADPVAPPAQASPAPAFATPATPIQPPAEPAGMPALQPAAQQAPTPPGFPR